MTGPSPASLSLGTLSPEGRGDVTTNCEDLPREAASFSVPSPLWGEGGSAKPRRVRGRKLTPDGVVRARVLRSKQTEAEQRFWSLVRNRNISDAKFVRQHAIGPYVADFVCRDRMLVVEIDGSQHGGSKRDVTRTAFLNAHGYSVLRFWNHEVMRELGGVELLLATALAGECPDSSTWRYAPSLSPKGRGDVTDRLGE